jgi:hypothetical protein
LMQIVNRISIHEKLKVCSISSFFVFVHADNLRTKIITNRCCCCCWLLYSYLDLRSFKMFHRIGVKRSSPPRPKKKGKKKKQQQQ